LAAYFNTNPSGREINFPDEAYSDAGARVWEAVC